MYKTPNLTLLPILTLLLLSCGGTDGTLADQGLQGPQGLARRRLLASPKSAEPIATSIANTPCGATRLVAETPPPPYMNSQKHR